MDLKYSKDLTLKQVRGYIWEDCIYPLLQEYLRGAGKGKDLKEFQEAFGL